MTWRTAGSHRRLRGVVRYVTEESPVGTYMSAFIGVDDSPGRTRFADGDYIHSLTEESFSRDGKPYELFDALAGGRGLFMAPGERRPQRLPLIPPRGMPHPCSLAVAQSYYRLVRERRDTPDRYFWPAWRCVTPRQAAAWVRSGKSREVQVEQSINGRRTWTLVSEPSHRFATWLRPSEVDASLAHHRLGPSKIPPCYRAMLAAMSSLVTELGPSRVRLVVWFV